MSAKSVYRLIALNRTVTVVDSAVDLKLSHSFYIVSSLNSRFAISLGYMYVYGIYLNAIKRILLPSKVSTGSL